MSPHRIEQRLRSLPAAFVFLDSDGRIIDATDQVATLIGWTPSQLVDRPVFELFAEPIASHLRDAVDRWSASGSSPLEGRLFRLDAATGSGTTLPVGIRIHRTGEQFAVAMIDERSGGDGLRSSLLDAVSEPVITSHTLSAVAAQVGLAFDWDLATVWATDDPGATLRAVAVWERDPDPDRRYRSSTLRQPLLSGEGLPGRAWQAREVMVVHDVGADPRFGAGYGTNRLPQSGAMIPVSLGRRVVGVLELLTYADVDASLWLASEAESIGSSLGQLVERFRDRLQADSIEGRLALALEAGDFGVWSLDVRSGVAEWSGRMAELHGIAETEGGAWSLFATVDPEDVPHIGHVLERARAADEPQTVEYRVRDADRGTVWISTRVTRVQVNGGPATLSAVASDVTERKRAELSLQRRRAAVEGLQWVSQAIIAGRQLADTAMAVANAATGVLGADHGVILYSQPGDVGSELAWAFSGIPGDAAVPDPPRGFDLTSVAAAATGVDVVPDLRRAPSASTLIDELELPIPADSIRSVLLVPIGGERGRALGLMVFVHRDPAYFTEDDARLAASIGTSTGVAIENARRHEEQRLAAVLFQRQLLPQDDFDLEGLDVCIRYHPGRDGLDVGGDWYDVIELDDHRIGLAVGDVCGHGLAAAAHMGQFRYSFRALIQASSSPEHAFQVVNRMALHELHTTATVAYVELDTRTGAWQTWSCGHLPPVVAAPHGTDARFIDDQAARGPMLGFLPEIEVRPVQGKLGPGELLLLYTDGLVERRGESIEVGLDRLHRSFAGRSPFLEDLCDELYNLLAAVGPEADDTVLVGVRRP